MKGTASLVKTQSLWVNDDKWQDGNCNIVDMYSGLCLDIIYIYIHIILYIYTYNIIYI